MGSLQINKLKFREGYVFIGFNNITLQIPNESRATIK